MRILFDIGHPAHVHLFRIARQILKQEGHDVFCIARNKEITRKLLELYEIDYYPGTNQIKGLGAIFELWPLFRKINKIINKHSINVTASIGSPAAAWASKVNKIPHLAFNDTETSPEQRVLYSPASTKIFTPKCLYGDFGRKQVRYQGTHDLAYLRPEHFTPDPTIRKELDVSENEKYAILRLVSWNATHDAISNKKTTQGISDDVFALLAQRYKVIISAEGELPDNMKQFRIKIHPHKIHDALAFASVVVSDGATMATEAAVLGRPSIYISNSRYINNLGCISYLSKCYRLLDTLDLEQYRPEKLLKLLDNLREAERQKERARLLNSTINVAVYIAECCIKFGENAHL
jgi:uncharacterized protein